MSKYMHTINGKPATFDGYQICYATFYGKANILCCSLAQIRKEQKLTYKHRSADGFDTVAGHYGYFRYE